MTDARAVAEAVTGPESFIAFVAALRAEVLHNAEHSGPFPVENYNFDDALESMQLWASTQVPNDRVAGMNPWAAAARLLLVGHYHE